jgi:hypothetical protein
MAPPDGLHSLFSMATASSTMILMHTALCKAMGKGSPDGNKLSKGKKFCWTHLPTMVAEPINGNLTSTMALVACRATTDRAT